MKKEKLIIIISSLCILLIAAILFIVLSGSNAKSDKYIFKTNDKNMCNGSHKINISDTSMLSIEEKRIDEYRDHNIDGGCFAYNYEVTVSGLKEGKASITVEYFDISNKKESNEIYYFNVDSNLKVEFEKMEEFVEKSTSKGAKIFAFETKDKDMCNGSHKVSVSDTSMLSVKEEKIDENRDPDVKGGCFAYNYEVTVSGLKEGKASITIEYFDISDNKEREDIYYFNVDSDLNVEFERMEGTVASSVS